jgi:hypothetical protein
VKRDRARMTAKRTLDAAPPNPICGAAGCFSQQPLLPARAGSPEGQSPFGQARQGAQHAPRH